MKSSKLTGLILKRSNYQEADKILTVFSKEMGKVKLLAKGVRRIKSRRAPHLELFNLVELVVRQGHSLDIITEAKIINDFPGLKNDLKSTGYLFYIAEVLEKIMPEHQSHEDVYRLTVGSLKSLTTENIQSVVKNFVVQLMWQLGYLPRGQYPENSVTNFVESIVERKIRSKRFIEQI